MQIKISQQESNYLRELKYIKYRGSLTLVLYYVNVILIYIPGGAIFISGKFNNLKYFPLCFAVSMKYLHIILCARYKFNWLIKIIPVLVSKF